MSEVWRPWDAEDDEFERRLIIREQIPVPLRPVVRSWLVDRLANSYGSTAPALIHALQSALDVYLGFPDGYVDTTKLVSAIEGRGDRFLLRVVDFLMSSYTVDYLTEPREITALRWHLDQTRSAVTITTRDQIYRLERRSPKGVEELAQEAVDSTNATAGQHLRNAWAKSRDIQPDPAGAMTEAIRAVEAAAGPVVIPKDQRPQLSKIVGAIRDNANWTLILETRDDGHPDQRDVLIGMLEVLAFAEQHRHSGTPPTSDQAMAHAQLAATLVGWFSAGAVVKGV